MTTFLIGLVILFALGSEFFSRYRIRYIKKAKEGNARG